VAGNKRGRDRGRQRGRLPRSRRRSTPGSRCPNVISGNPRQRHRDLRVRRATRSPLNFIGSDATGKLLARQTRGTGSSSRRAPNAQPDRRARRPGGNDPTAGVIVRPPQGNLISGNHANGVLINSRSTQNMLSGNFVGTNRPRATNPLGNWGDLAWPSRKRQLQQADRLHPSTRARSSSTTCSSGNGHNGLRITNSNNTTVHANFMGVGANNATIVPNGGNGPPGLGHVPGTPRSAGVIPLGNVISGNNRATASRCATRPAALVLVQHLHRDLRHSGGPPRTSATAILITSTGGNKPDPHVHRLG